MEIPGCDIEATLRTLGVTRRIQQHAIKVLSGSRNGKLESGVFRELIIQSLARAGHTRLFLQTINSEIELLIEAKLIVRETHRAVHKTTLNPLIWLCPD